MKKPRTKKTDRARTAVTRALHESIQRKQARILKLFGTIEFDPAYDYKKQRRKE